MWYQCSRCNSGGNMKGRLMHPLHKVMRKWLELLCFFSQFKNQQDRSVLPCFPCFLFIIYSVFMLPILHLSLSVLTLRWPRNYRASFTIVRKILMLAMLAGYVDEMFCYRSLQIFLPSTVFLLGPYLLIA